MVGSVRAIECEDCLVVGIVCGESISETVFKDCLLIGFVRTIDFGACLVIGIV